MVVGMEVTFRTEDAELPATLTLPTGVIRGGIVTLHGATAGHRSYFLYEHVSRVLPEQGVAVLRYDRRAAIGDDDVPLGHQASDAIAAVRLLRGQIGAGPIGLWGYSQGAWAAPLAAATARSGIAFLILVSSCGVSPAVQMRIGTDKQLRRHGFGNQDRAELAELRTAFEDYLRGQGDRAAAQAMVDRMAERPWFPLVYIPRELPDVGVWTDMDFDPQPVFAKVGCPVLAFYGETDAWMPIEESINAWRRAGEQSRNNDITVVRLAGCDHKPTLDEGSDADAISPTYTLAMSEWLQTRLSGT